jgi:hypothetical protein
LKPPNREVVSSGHLLGQLIGDWWEKFVVKPLLEDVADRLDLFADCRYVTRSCRGEKIQWSDNDGNIVDYDFVLELNGSNASRGTPVAFLESFWRRGARHSKDKARDDTNKLLPMMDTYPSARFAAIAACGEFTEPAREYVKSRNVNLFFIPKTNIIAAFSQLGLQIDYSDQAPEEEKRKIVQAVQFKLNDKICAEVANKLREISGVSSFSAFTHSVISSLSAYPQEIRIRQASISNSVLFHDVKTASAFLKSPNFEFSGNESSYIYDVAYSDGTQFHRRLENLTDLRNLHNQLLLLVTHMEKLNANFN